MFTGLTARDTFMAMFLPLPDSYRDWYSILIFNMVIVLTIYFTHVQASSIMGNQMISILSLLIYFAVMYSRLCNIVNNFYICDCAMSIACWSCMFKVLHPNLS